MTHGSLFSGIGGFDLAAEWMGWQNVFHCEWNPFGQKVLKHHFPKSIGYNDITKTDFSVHRGAIDILIGGFPCQPFSQAGKRKGTEDERYLWKEMLRAIREIQPRFVVGENVFGLINWGRGLVFNEVQTDLEIEGYEVFPYVLPACGVNAPHRRDRVWFVATRKLGAGSAPNPNGKSGESHIERGWKINRQEGTEVRSNVTSISEIGIITDTNSGGVERYGRSGKTQYIQTTEFNENDCKKFRRVDWEEFPTQSPVCGGDDGFSAELDSITFSNWKKESIKAFGNAIVPQVAFQIFKSIEEYEKIVLKSVMTNIHDVEQVKTKM